MNLSYKHHLNKTYAEVNKTYEEAIETSVPFHLHLKKKEQAKNTTKVDHPVDTFSTIHLR